MPPTLKVKGKSRSKKRKGKGKKKGKKKKAEINPPPLHHLTELYNQLREKVFDLQRTQVKARKKRLEGWYMTREMLSLKHDNEVYHDYLKEKMEDVERLIKDITSQLDKERAEVERLIKERMAEYEKKLAEYRHRIIKGESDLSELRIKLLEFEPLMKKLAALMARLKELQDQLAPLELEANMKTRHLKNQYLNERAKLHNHLEDELFKLVTTCRRLLMPIMADHMYYMESENMCSRAELSRLDLTNFEMSRKKELLLEKRNRLNMERGYLSMDWAFGKLSQSDAKKKEALEQTRKLTGPPTPGEECELSIAFKQYLNKRLAADRLQKEREARLQKRREAKQRLLEIQQAKERLEAEKTQRALEAIKKEMGVEEEDDEEEEWEHHFDHDEYEDDEEDMEYYEDELGNLVLATASRMKAHKAIMENKSLKDLANEGSGDDDDDLDDDEDEFAGEHSGESGEGSESTLSSGSKLNSDDAITINGDEEDYGQADIDHDDDASQKASALLLSAASSLFSSMSKNSTSSKHHVVKEKVKPVKHKPRPKKK